MDFILWVLFTAALIYIWRRTEDLQSRLFYFEQLVESLRAQLAQGSREQAAGAASDELPETIEEVQQPIEPIADPAPTAIPAMRREVQEAIEAPVEEPSVEEPPAAEVPAEGKAQERTGWRPSFDFEDIFGRLLPIWAGGVTLAVAGFFLVKYSIERGLLGPEVRVALGFLFGAALIGGAEIAYRQERRLSDPRVRQALAGAGLATLYASFYLAGSLYGLVGNTIAFLGLAGVTGAAIALSFRFGLPSAILGLVGGFAAPMLVGSEEANLPLLALYLALVTGGLTYAGNRQGRSWLALAALAGGLGWGFLILLSGVTGIGDVLAFGGYLVVLGALVPAFTDGRDAAPWLRMGAGGLAAVQMAVMVEQAGFSLLAWGLYGLLAAALAFFAWRDARLRPASAFAAAIAAFMLLFWTGETLGEFATVATGLTAIFAGVPLANIWRGAHRPIDTYQLGAFALAMIGVTYAQFTGEGSANLLALACFAIALLPALGAFLLWPSKDDRIAHSGIVTLVAAAVGIAIAGLIATPLWAAPLVVGIVALGLIALCWTHEDERLLAICWVSALATFMALLAGPQLDAEAYRLSGSEDAVDRIRAVLRWLFASLPPIALALRKNRGVSTHAAEIFGTLLVYGLIAQIIPGDALAWVAAGFAVALATVASGRFAARLTSFGLTLLWAAQVLILWSSDAFLAAGSQPMMIADAVGWKMIGLQLLPAVIAGASVLWRRLAIFVGKPPVFEGMVALIGVVMIHLVFKQLFAITDIEQFVALGLLERTLWQALLLGGALGVMRLAAGQDWAKPLAIGLASCSLAHFLLFSFGWHNPLWDEQAVGGLPAANLLLPAYGVALTGTWWLSRNIESVAPIPRRMFDILAMLLIAVFALSELRHAFAGTILTQPSVGQAEDLLRSLLGIVLAIGFLLWGTRSKTRSWRIGSLVLMLGAVLKVFLLDAGGLEGLVRVASFVALGFSLIGIGWFYARQLTGETKAKEAR